MRLSNLIEKPIITEKGVNQIGLDRYEFKVARNATKHSIAEEINRMFGVDVMNVKTMIVPGKSRRIRGTRNFSRTGSWKKAIVQIKEGQKIDMFAGLLGGEGK